MTDLLLETERLRIRLWHHDEAPRRLDVRGRVEARGTGVPCRDSERSIAVVARNGMPDRGVTDRWYDGPSRLSGTTRAEWSAGRG